LTFLFGSCANKTGKPLVPPKRLKKSLSLILSYFRPPEPGAEPDLL
jgi:hypothetical protein